MSKHLFTLLLVFMLFIYGCDKRESSSSDTNAAESSANVQDMTSSAKYAAELSCHIGEVDSRSGCNTVINDPNKPVNPKVKITAVIVRVLFIMFYLKFR